MTPNTHKWLKVLKIIRGTSSETIILQHKSKCRDLPNQLLAKLPGRPESPFVQFFVTATRSSALHFRGELPEPVALVPQGGESVQPGLLLILLPFGRQRLGYRPLEAF